jgi:hypothetical protein
LAGEPVPPEPPDTGFRRIMTWLVIALIVSILMAFLGVSLAVRFFEFFDTR